VNNLHAIRSEIHNKYLKQQDLLESINSLSRPTPDILFRALAKTEKELHEAHFDYLCSKGTTYMSVPDISAEFSRDPAAKIAEELQLYEAQYAKANIARRRKGVSNVLLLTTFTIFIIYAALVLHPDETVRELPKRIYDRITQYDFHNFKGD